MKKTLKNNNSFIQEDQSARNSHGNSRDQVDDNAVSGSKNKMLIKKKKPWSMKKKILVSTAGVLVLLLIASVLYVISFFIDPRTAIKELAQYTNTPAPSVQPEVSGGTPVSTPTIDPYEELKAQADFSMLNGIVNILLIGVDHGSDRDTNEWVSHGGKTDWHSDVMIIVSINTNTNQVSLISLPRDTYVKMPGVDGIYKLNLSLNCGGGWPSETGFQKVCDAASWMIGGIPIKYYYAVDFNAVKELVDAIGGVDFNINIAFTINGRSYNTGLQHMDGQGALDYMRVRKEKNIVDPTGETGDLNRINRQKAMLVAIFDKLKSSGVIFNIPNILGAFQGNLYTNAKLTETATFAAYAYENVDPKNIKVYSMDGKYAYYLFNYHFVITDLNKRVQIIKEVYGIDISKDKQYSKYYSQYKKYNLDNALDLWYDMQTEVALTKSRSLLDNVKLALDEDALLPPYPTESTEPTETAPAGSEEPVTSPTDTPAPTAPPTPIPSDGYRKYGDDIRLLYETTESEYAGLESWVKPAAADTNAEREALLKKYKTDVQQLCEAVLSMKNDAKQWDKFWLVIYNAEKKRDINQEIIKNEIYVDFA